MFCITVSGLNLGRLQYRDPIANPDALEAKLTGLMSERLYRVYLAASTKFGRGEPIFMDLETTSPISKYLSILCFNTAEPPLRGHPDERLTPLERPL